MHFHVIIVAALSAGALSISLTAKNPTFKGNPNLKCEGGNSGKLVQFDPMNCSTTEPNCNCHLYEPESSYIWIDYTSWDLKDDYAEDEKMYEISVFSDVNCEDYLDTVVPSGYVMDDGFAAYHAHDSNCVFMGNGVQWKSVMPLAEYNATGVNKVDGTDTWGNNLDPKPTGHG